MTLSMIGRCVELRVRVTCQILTGEEVNINREFLFLNISRSESLIILLSSENFCCVRFDSFD